MADAHRTRLAFAAVAFMVVGCTNDGGGRVDQGTRPVTDVGGRPEAGRSDGEPLVDSGVAPPDAAPPGDASLVGDAGPPVLWSRATLDALVRGWIVLGYCNGGSWTGDITRRVVLQSAGRHTRGPADAGGRFVTRTIEDYQSCGVFDEKENPFCRTPPTDGSTLVTRCNGNVLTNCETGRFSETLDCAEFGGTCGDAFGDRHCLFDDCDPRMDRPYMCRGGDSVRCAGGKQSLIACFGAIGCQSGPATSPADYPFPEICIGAIYDTCRVQGENEAWCAGAGPPCNGPSRCEGNVLVSCAYGFESRWDCNNVVEGMICREPTEDGFPARCAWADENCNDMSPASCDGTVLRFCLLGHYETFDCASIGASKCVETPVPANEFFGPTVAADCTD